MRTIDSIAQEMIRCALTWAPNACIVGNVMSKEVVAAVAEHVTGCPACGAEPWVNIDCQTCLAVSAVLDERRDA